MIIKVIKDAYYVSEDLTGIGMVDKATLEASYSHLLVVGDVWASTTIDGYTFFECIEGTWDGESSDGWWEYEGFEGYFEVVE
jgi:hypothetical protein